MLSLKGVSRHFGGLQVLSDVNLSVPAGSIFGLIGPNGAGKTTLINQLHGELRSDAGRIELAGKDITHWPVHARARAGLGRSYQITAVLREFTVLENVLLAVQAVRGHNFHFWRPVTSIPSLVEAADRYLGMVGLLGVRRRSAGLLSYGQQRQLELAMTLAVEPRLLLLDEPVAGMNSAEKSELMGGIVDIRQRGYTVLIIEHDMPFVMGLCEQIAVLNFGRIIAEGRPEQIRSDPQVIEAYLGRDDDDAAAAGGAR